MYNLIILKKLILHKHKPVEPITRVNALFNKEYKKFYVNFKYLHNGS